LMQEIVDLVNQYGVPTVVAVGMSYFIYYIWKFVTTEILPTLGNAMTTLIALIDRIRMLDNDMIRLDQKINTIIELNEQERERQKDEKSK
jgi:hypothetical protein